MGAVEVVSSYLGKSVACPSQRGKGGKTERSQTSLLAAGRQGVD